MQKLEIYNEQTRERLQKLMKKGVTVKFINSCLSDISINTLYKFVSGERDMSVERCIRVNQIANRLERMIEDVLAVKIADEQ